MVLSRIGFGIPTARRLSSSLCFFALRRFAHFSMTRSCAATLVVRYVYVGRAEQMPGWVILSGWHSIRNIIRCSLSKEDNEPCRRLRAVRMHYRSGERSSHARNVQQLGLGTRSLTTRKTWHDTIDEMLPERNIQETESISVFLPPMNLNILRYF